MPDESRIASGHAEIAEKARENVRARARAVESDERTIDIAATATDFSAMGAHVSAQVARLAAVMRSQGARVGLGEVLSAERALAAVDASDRAEVFFALRTALCSTRAEVGAFAAAFTTVFGSDTAPDALDELGEIAKQALPRVAVPPQGDEAPAADLTPAPAAWSEEELLREKDFGAYTDAERAMARRLLARIALRGPKRRSRRTVPTTRRRDEHDLRATIRVSLRHGGELLERRYREQALRPRRLVLICDVSGSMAPYSRMLLQYMQACVAARARVEAFVFGTRLTRVTRELRGRDSDRALMRAAAAVTDWSGGTRIGEAIAELNREHGRRIGRGSMVILLSDGWDRGEPEQLAEEMARLARTAYKVIWLNPLAADPRYEPLTRGMKAAMPYVDRLLPGNSISSLEALADLMESRDGVNPAGLILAAGAGTRFGDATKQLADLCGKPLLQHAVDTMNAALERVVVVLGHDADAIRARIDFGGATVVVCEQWAQGQGFSLRTGVAATAGADAVVITLGDQPFITPKVIAGALLQLEGHDAVRALYDGAPGHPVVLGRAVLDAVPELEGDAGARELLARFNVHRWEAGHLASSVDVDTPQELARLDDCDTGVCGGDVPPLIGQVLTGTGLTLAQAAARLERGEALPALTPVQRRIAEEYVLSRADAP